MPSNSFHKTTNPKTAMLLAAGLGTRLRPLTDKIPKPLIKVAGKTLLERGLDLLVKADVKTVVINVHYLADQIIDFIEQLKSIYSLKLIISDERHELLDSAGGIIKALPLLGNEPFYVLNSDTFWHEAINNSNFLRLSAAFKASEQDMLLLTLPKTHTLVPQQGDFLQDHNNHLIRADKSQDNPRAVIYAGGLILNPAIFDKSLPIKPQSLNVYFDKALARERLFGLNLEAKWLSVGTPAELQQAEAYLTNQS